MEQPRTRPRIEVEERRLLTVMFGDMVGSTSISEAIGADSMHELLKAYQRACTQSVIDSDGVVTSWMGDGFMAHFGYPSRHEDAAVRAVEGGLAVLSAVRALGPELMKRFGVRVALRVGIHTGLVVVSREPGREDDPNAVSFTGETTNVAARIESTARPNSVSISEATWELVRGYFDVDPLGPQQLRGLTRQVTTYRVRDRTSAPSRYFARGDRLTPLVGRELELRELLEFTERDLGGRGGFLGLIGEAGMGKTRLLDELVHRAGPSRDVLYTTCSPRDTASPLHPFARLVRELSRAPGRSADVTFAAFTAQIGPDVPNEIARARLAALAEIEPPAELIPHDVTPERALQETADAARGWLSRRADRGGAVLLVDDAQWLDPTSRDLLARTSEEQAAPGVVLAYRPEPDTEWIGSFCGSALELRPLSQAECVDLIGHVVDGGDQRVGEAASRSDGVPLFAEELARTLGNGDLPEFGSFPSSLHDLVVSRLDRIPEARVLAQVGASIGREFELDLLAEATGLPPATVLDQATALESARIWERGQTSGTTAFTFRHALLQDASYDSQIRERKHHVHGRIADVLVGRNENTTAGGLATIAHHLENAGPSRLPAAAAGWAASGFATADGGAHVEAISQFTRGLGLVHRIEDPAVAAPLELQFQLGVGASLSTTAGYGHALVQAAFARAGELCEGMGSPPELYPAMWGMWSFHLVRGEYAVADELARTCARIAATAQDPALEIESAVGLGLTAFYRGRLREAIRTLSGAVERYRATRAIPSYQRFQHPAVAALSHLALANWLVGDAEAARRSALAATDMADSCEEHLRWFAQEYAHTFCAALGAYSGDGTCCLRHAQQAIDVCHRYGSQMFLAGAEIYKGHGQVELAALDEGSARIEAACESYLRTGATLFRPYHLVLLARARWARGDASEALDALDTAAELAEHNGELVHLPLILAERGRTLRGIAGNDAPVGADLRRAIELADELGIDRRALGLRRAASTVPEADLEAAMPPDVAMT
jgi:class 3 adenylate cyclase/predicted ATPase